MTDLDAALARIEEREAQEAAKRRKAEPDPDAMYKVVNAAIAKAGRAHRIATEHVEIKSFEC